jgi:hypothetical protein
MVNGSLFLTLMPPVAPPTQQMATVVVLQDFSGCAANVRSIHHHILKGVCGPLYLKQAICPPLAIQVRYYHQSDRD